jgi:hypothetical protein
MMNDSVADVDERGQRTPIVKEFLDELGAFAALRGKQAALAAAAAVMTIAVAGASVARAGPLDTDPVVAGPDGTAPLAEPGIARRMNRLSPAAGQAGRTPGVRPAVPPYGEQLAVVPSPVPRSEPSQPLRIDVPCARIEASIGDGTVDLRGYARQGSDLSRLKHALLSIPGVKRVSNSTRQITDTLCRPIDLFAAYMATNGDSPRGPSIRANQEDGRYREGDKLVVSLTAPEHDSYVYVDYFSLGGNVIHLLPRAGAPTNLVPADRSLTLGHPGSTKQWVIGPPFGTDVIIVLASPVAVFSSMRREVERQEDYLPALQRNLDRIFDRLGSGRITADIFFITTSSR